MSKRLHLLLSNDLYDKITNGLETHIYKDASQYWEKRFDWSPLFKSWTIDEVTLQKGLRNNPEKMLFKIKGITLDNGSGKFDIELGEKIS